MSSATPRSHFYLPAISPYLTVGLLLYETVLAFTEMTGWSYIIQQGLFAHTIPRAVQNHMCVCVCVLVCLFSYLDVLHPLANEYLANDSFPCILQVTQLYNVGTAKHINCCTLYYNSHNVNFHVINNNNSLTNWWVIIEQTRKIFPTLLCILSTKYSHPHTFMRWQFKNSNVRHLSCFSIKIWNMTVGKCRTLTIKFINYCHIFKYMTGHTHVTQKDDMH